MQIVTWSLLSIFCHTVSATAKSKWRGRSNRYCTHAWLFSWCCRVNNTVASYIKGRGPELLTLFTLCAVCVSCDNHLFIRFNVFPPVRWRRCGRRRKKPGWPGWRSRTRSCCGSTSVWSNSSDNRWVVGMPCGQPKALHEAQRKPAQREAGWTESANVLLWPRKPSVTHGSRSQ